MRQMWHPKQTILFPSLKSPAKELLISKLWQPEMSEGVIPACKSRSMAGSDTGSRIVRAMDGLFQSLHLHLKSCAEYQGSLVVA